MRSAMNTKLNQKLFVIQRILIIWYFSRIDFMKKLLYPLAVLFFFASCGKEKFDKTDTLTYYSEDYKESTLTILGLPANEIDALWVEFSAADKEDYSSYTLIAKSDGEFAKETGTCEIDWVSQITFYPYGQDSYTGVWISEKDKYEVSYDSESRTEVLTFIYKETKDCWKGKF